LDDHRYHKVALTGRLRGNQTVETELVNHLQHGLDMAVRDGAKGAKGLVGGNESLAFEAAAHQFDRECVKKPPGTSA